MNIIKILKLRKYIKSIDKDIKVRFGKAFECDTDRKIIWLALKDNRLDSEMFKTWYEKHFNETLTDKDLLYISALHEVGHIMTWTQPARLQLGLPGLHTITQRESKAQK